MRYVVKMDVSGVVQFIGIDEPFMYDVVYYGIMLSATLLAAVLSWNILEQPFLRLKRLFPYDGAKQAAPTTAT